MPPDAGDLWEAVLGPPPVGEGGLGSRFKPAIIIAIQGRESSDEQRHYGLRKVQLVYMHKLTHCTG